MIEPPPRTRRRLRALVASVVLAAVTAVAPPASAADTVPGVPRDHVASYDAALDRITSSWNPPTTGGGSLPVTAYDVFFDGAYLRSFGPNDRSVTISSAGGLPLGPHDIGVRAVNSIGPGATSTISVLVARAPGAPTGVGATAGNASATVSWSAAAPNGAPVSGYRVTASPGGASVTVGGSLRSAVVPGLSNGVAYTFRVVATNAVGDSPPSSASAAVTPSAPPSAPSAPTGVTAVAGTTSATVSWTAAAANGSPVTGYRVTASPGGASVGVGGSTTSVVVPGLTNGVAYTFRVVATNALGDSPQSAASGAVTPAGVPGPPADVVAVAGNASASVTWTAASSNGAAVTAYRVTASPGGASVSVGGGTRTAVVPGLTNGTAYTFRVVATNSVGDSTPSTASAAVTPEGVPGAPTQVAATAGTASASVSWTASAPNGSPVTGYRVTASPGGATASVSGGATSTLVTGLTNGTAYTFRVVATNAVGDSPPSVASSAVTPAGVPGAPADVAATAGNGSASVTWGAAVPNGSPVTGYRVTAAPGGAAVSVVGSARAALVPGLTNGKAYTFRVVATNAVGDSAVSAPSGAVTPAAAPGAPTQVSATAGNAWASVSWAASVPNGSPVTAYRVTASPGGASTTVPGTSTTALVTGLANGTTYTFRVVATNAVGDSGQSTASPPVTPAAAPGAPTEVVASAGNATVTVSWVASEANGSPVTGYRVTASPGGASVGVDGERTSAVLPGLTNGTPYSFRVVASNARGDSPPSTASNTVTPLAPATVPGAPTEVQATAGNASATVSWTASVPNGSTVTGYRVTASPGGASVSVPGTVTTAVVPGLGNGTTYDFRVVATNGVGDSPASTVSNAVTPVAPPSAPTQVGAVAGDASATVTWTAAAPNGSPVTSYRVTASPGGGSVSVGGGSTSALVSGLANGTTYTFRVVATNAVGDSPSSAASGGVTPVAPVVVAAPGAPTAVAASAGDRSATVTWVPSVTNGTPVTGYRVLVDPPAPDAVAATVAGDATGAEVAGLANGTAYTFRVVALSAAGDSPASAASAPVTPRAPASPPEAPTLVVAAGRDAAARVSWSAAVANGSPVTGYRVTASPGGASVTVPVTGPGDETAALVEGLTNQVAYTFRVVALSQAGDSPTSAPSNEVVPRAPATAPDAPTGVVAAAGVRSATVLWDAAPPQGAPVTGYVVTATPGGATVLVPGTATQVVVDGLVAGRAYTFRVMATNDAGDSPVSAPSNEVVPGAPATPPDAPGGVVAVAGDGSLTVSWEASAANGTPVTGYRVSASPGVVAVTVPASSTTAVLDGLANGTAYTVRVVALSDAGESAPGAEPAGVVPAGRPGRPDRPRLRAVGRSITVRWAAAAPNGSPVSRYRVKLDGRTVVTTAERRAVLRRVAPGGHRVRVIAVNAAGRSPSSLAAGVRVRR